VSELNDLRQRVEALLQECERRLSVVERQRSRMETGASARTTESGIVNQTANNKNRSKNRTANQAALEQLIEIYPQTFSRDDVRPLKVGIQEDLIADGKLARNRIKRALATYVRSFHYLRAVKEGVDRIDLSGEAAGQVTAAEAEHAAARLQEIQAQRKERQKQERAKQQAARQQQKEERLNRKLETLINLKGR